MGFLQPVIDVILHIDTFIDKQVGVLGPWIYVVFFVIIFMETGFVVTPFLPGDSLLFAAGAVAARPGNPLSIWILFFSMLIAGILGDSCNYWIGKRMGPAVLKRPDSKVFKREYLDKTHAFYHKYGGKTIILARFVPIVRTFAPFLAGVGTMDYRRFFTFNVVGAFAWVTSFLFAGYFFGRIPAVEENLSLTVLGVVVVTTIPIVWEAWRQRRAGKAGAVAAEVPEHSVEEIVAEFGDGEDGAGA